MIHLLCKTYGWTVEETLKVDQYLALRLVEEIQADDWNAWVAHVQANEQGVVRGVGPMLSKDFKPDRLPTWDDYVNQNVIRDPKTAKIRTQFLKLFSPTASQGEQAGG